MNGIGLKSDVQGFPGCGKNSGAKLGVVDGLAVIVGQHHPETSNSPLKNSQLPRRCKKFKPSRINKYASTLFFCFLHLGFLNGLPKKTFNTQVDVPDSGVRGHTLKVIENTKRRNRVASYPKQLEERIVQYLRGPVAQGFSPLNPGIEKAGFPARGVGAPVFLQHLQSRIQLNSSGLHLTPNHGQQPLAQGRTDVIHGAVVALAVPLLPDPDNEAQALQLARGRAHRGLAQPELFLQLIQRGLAVGQVQADQHLAHDSSQAELLGHSTAGFNEAGADFINGIMFFHYCIFKKS
jgi:hypothetical protein